MAALERAFDGIDFASLLPLLFFLCICLFIVSAWCELTKGPLPINQSMERLRERLIEEAEQSIAPSIDPAS